MRIRFLLLGVVIIFPIVLNGCVQQQGDELQQTTRTLKGVSLSPKSYEGNDFTAFFEKAKQIGDIIMWAGDWSQVSDSSITETMEGLASIYDYIPLIEATYFNQSTGELIRPLDEETRQYYLDGVVAYVEKYQPYYLGLGIEVNSFYEKNPEDFYEFIYFYNEVYDAVKAVSHDTKVFTVFQLEKMKGLNIWSTDPYDPDKAQWFLLDKFKTDIVAFTTYPCLVYKDPSDILEDHYTEILSHISKPIAFTEIGWHSEASPIGWESNETEQAEFISRFFVLTEDLNVEIAIWSFLYDPDAIEPFRSMGLCRSDGSVRPAWNAWLEGRG